MSTVWMLTVIFGSVIAATLALPSLPEYVDGPVTARALFRPEWLLVATFVVLPLYRASRLSWPTGLALVPIASVHVLYIVNSAVDASQRAGLVDGISSTWYVVAFIQVGIFTIVAAVGAYRNIADRRWVRLMRSLTATARGPQPSSAPQPPSRTDLAINRRRPHPPRSGLAKP